MKAQALAVLAFVLTFAAQASASQAASSIYVSPAHSEADLGGSFSIGIGMSTDENAYAVSFDVYYDNSMLEATGLVDGGFLTQDGTNIYTVKLINNTAGRITYAVTRFNVGTGVNGSGTLLTIAFNAISEGSSAIDLENADLVVMVGGQLDKVIRKPDITDGDVDVVESATPLSSCSIITQPGRYILSQDLIGFPAPAGKGCIDIEAEGVELDCKGHEISSDLATAGVYVGRQAAAVRNCNIDMSKSSGGVGIRLYNASYSRIEGNTLAGQHEGVYLDKTNHATVKGNIADNNSETGIYFRGNLNNNTISGNDASGNGFYGIYVTGNGNRLLSNTAGRNGHSGISIWLLSSNNLIQGDAVNGNSMYGVFVTSSSRNNTFRDITANNNEYGIMFAFNLKNRLENITASNNTFGIYLFYSSSNLLDGIRLDGNEYGLVIYYANKNNITGLAADGNDYGVYIWDFSSGNRLESSSVSHSTYHGIHVSYSSGNSMFNDTVSGNGYGFYVNGSGTVISDSYAEGNDIGIYFAGGSSAVISGTTACTNANKDFFCQSGQAGPSGNGNMFGSVLACSNWPVLGTHYTQCGSGGVALGCFIRGDVVRDYRVNVFDLASIGIAFGTKELKAGWNQNADVNGDSVVNIFDLSAVGIDFGLSCQ